MKPAVAVRAVVVAPHFAQLYGVDDQGDEAELGVPTGVLLIMGCLLQLRVAAQVQNGRMGAGTVGDVQIRLYLETRQALVVQALDAVTVPRVHFRHLEAGLRPFI